MKDYHIYLFNNIANMETVVGYINLKDQFINNSFLQVPHVLIYLTEDLTYRKEVPLRRIQSHLIPEHSYSIPEFTQKYSSQIEKVRKYNEVYGPPLSWLEVFQVAIMLDNTTMSDEVVALKIKKLGEFKVAVNKAY